MARECHQLGCGLAVDERRSGSLGLIIHPFAKTTVRAEDPAASILLRSASTSDLAIGPHAQDLSRACLAVCRWLPPLPPAVAGAAMAAVAEPWWSSVISREFHLRRLHHHRFEQFAQRRPRQHLLQPLRPHQFAHMGRGVTRRTTRVHGAAAHNGRGPWVSARAKSVSRLMRRVCATVCDGAKADASVRSNPIELNKR